MGQSKFERFVSGAALVITVLVIFITIFLLMFSSDRAHAQLVPAPDLDAQDANCFRSIIDADDLYCSLRYDLPTQTDPDVIPGTPEEWCQYLFDTDGCTSDPVDPTFAERLESGLAFVTFYDGCTATGDCSAAASFDTGRIPRVGTSLAGIYLETGHTVTWQDSDVYGCVESSSLLFSVQTRDCAKVNWSTAANITADMRDDLGNHFVDQMLQLEIIQSRGVNHFVENNLITATGKQIIQEALNVADRILTVFRTSAASVIDSDFATAAAESNLQATITASDPIDIGGTVGGFFGGGQTTGGLIASLVGGFIAFGAIWTVQQRFGDARGADALQLPLAGLFTVAIFMMMLNEIPFNIIAVIGTILAAPGVVTVYRKLFG